MSGSSNKRDGPRPAPSRARRIWRRLYRCARTTLLIVVLIVVVAGFFLNKVGLPEFVKQRVVAQLRAQGWEVEFSRLRLRWYRGLVAEDLQLRRADRQPGPLLFLDAAECSFNRDAYRRLKLEVNTVKLAGGRLAFPLARTNQSPAWLQLDDAGGQLRLRTNDVWELHELHGRIFNTRVQFSGTLSNGSIVRDWKFPQRPRTAPGAEGNVWSQIVTNLERLKFTGTPELHGRFDGDARDLRTLHADLKYLVRAVDSPWGRGTNFLLHARLLPPQTSNSWVHADLRLEAEDAITPWGRAQSLRLDWEVEPSYTQWFPTNALLALDVRRAESPWGRLDHLAVTARLTRAATNSMQLQTELKAVGERVRSEWADAARVSLTASLSHPATNLLPVSVTCDLTLAAVRTRWGTAHHVVAKLHGALPPREQFTLFQTNLILPARLENIPFDARATLTQVEAPQGEADEISLTVDWRAPQLRVETSSRLYNGEFTAQTALDAATRELTFTAHSSIDARKISPQLTKPAQAWLASYQWKSPPKLTAQGRVILPAWTNRQPDWRGEVLPTFTVAGAFEVGEGAYRGVTFTAARSPFFYTNFTWRIPDLRVTRPEGDLAADYTSDTRAHDFHWRVRSAIDPMAIRPLLEKESERRVLDFFQLTTPPVLEAEVWGRWRDTERLGFTGRVWATNVTFRGERVTDCSAQFIYTNKVLRLIDPVARQGEARGAAPGLTIDLAAEKLYLTNAFGNLNPYSVARAIGRHAIAAIEPYQFETPPTTRAHGVIDLSRRGHATDLHFEVSGGVFHWPPFHLQQAAANLDWVGEHLSLTNAHGAFRTGRITGGAEFDFRREKGTEFAFQLALAEVDLRSFATDIGYQTNKLEGMLSGELIITNALSSDPRSWQGRGQAHLRDGLLWDIPVFAIFSPILNAAFPGLGNSRAKQATSTFLITNSVIYTEDLNIHATAMRMHFDGTVGFDKRIEGTMEAELLRDMPAFGFLISKILWPVTKIFEYRVSGTIDQPKTEPRYILPKVLLMPFHPLKTLKELLPDDPKPSPEKKAP